MSVDNNFALVLIVRERLRVAKHVSMRINAEMVGKRDSTFNIELSRKRSEGARGEARLTSHEH